MVQAKLRGCCDGCTKSKLKCSGEMPSCQRCRIRSLDCVYSKARRAGRLRLKPKPSKASIVCSVDREPRIDLTSYSGQPFNGVQCSKSELALPSLPDFVHYSPDSQDISVLMQDPWASTPRLGSDVTQTSTVCDFDDLMLQDMLLNSPEGFGSASAMTLKQEWRHDNTLFRDGLEDPCPGHGATSQGPPGHTSSSPSGFYTVTIQNTDGTNSYLTEVDMEINAIMATITDIAKRPIGSYHLDDHPCVTSWPQLLSKAQLLMYIAGFKKLIFLTSGCSAASLMGCRAGTKANFGMSNLHASRRGVI